MSAKPSDTETLAPPGARPRRAVSRFRPFVVPALIAEALAIAVTILTWTQLRALDHSLVLNGAGLAVVRVFEIATGVAVLVVPMYGARAIVRSLQARRLARLGEMQDARIAVEDSQHDVLWVVGLGLMAMIIAFSAFVMAANHGHVRQVLFNWSLIWSSRTALIRGFWWNIRLFVVAQVLVLIWALFVAVVRQLPGPAFAPVRFLAIAYTDVFRGIPAIIVIYLIDLPQPIRAAPAYYEKRPRITKPSSLEGRRQDSTSSRSNARSASPRCHYLERTIPLPRYYCWR